MKQKSTLDRIRKIKRAIKQGRTKRETADILGMDYKAFSSFVYSQKIVFPPLPGGRRCEIPSRRKIDHAAMHDLSEQGLSAAEIAAELGVTEDAIQQALRKTGGQLQRPKIQARGMDARAEAVRYLVQQGYTAQEIAIACGITVNNLHVFCHSRHISTRRKA